jgi:hypothetical protein
VVGLIDDAVGVPPADDQTIAADVGFAGVGRNGAGSKPKSREVVIPA